MSDSAPLLRSEEFVLATERTPGRHLEAGPLKLMLRPLTIGQVLLLEQYAQDAYAPNPDAKERRIARAEMVREALRMGVLSVPELPHLTPDPLDADGRGGWSAAALDEIGRLLGPARQAVASEVLQRNVLSVDAQKKSASPSG